MGINLSPQSEAYIQQVVATGQYPSPEAAIDAAVAALREQNENILYVPDEHMEAVEQGLAEADAGLSRPMTEADWARLHQLARDVAAGRRQGS